MRYTYGKNAEVIFDSMNELLIETADGEWRIDKTSKILTGGYQAFLNDSMFARTAKMNDGGFEIE